MISFTFDDFPRSSLAVGGAVLHGQGLHGTYYVAGGLADTVGPMGPFFSWQDVADCERQGHEIGGHTFSHVSLIERPKADIIADIEMNRRALKAYDVRNFSYPFGRTELALGRFLTQEFQSCRGTHPGINGENTDLNHLQAVSIYPQRPLDALIDMIEEVRHSRGWLIFYTHDVGETPSDFGCSIAVFERVVAAARRSGAMVAPVRDCLAALRGRNETAQPVSDQPAMLSSPVGLGDEGRGG